MCSDGSLPYRLILTLACLVLAARYVVDSTGSPVWRWTIGAITTVSFLLPRGLSWDVAGIAIQLAVSLFVLLRGAMVRARS